MTSTEGEKLQLLFDTFVICYGQCWLVLMMQNLIIAPAELHPFPSTETTIELLHSRREVH